MFIYFEIHVWCIMSDESSTLELLTDFMLAVELSALTDHSSHDSDQFYLFCNIHLFLKFLVSRISSCLNIISIIFHWLNLFLLRVFKYHLLAIIVLICHFHVCLLILLRSVVNVCMLKNHVLSLLSLSFMQRFLIFFMLMKSWSKIKLLWKKRKNV